MHFIFINYGLLVKLKRCSMDLIMWYGPITLPGQ